MQKAKANEASAARTVVAAADAERSSRQVIDRRLVVIGAVGGDLGNDLEEALAF